MAHRRLIVPIAAAAILIAAGALWREDYTVLRAQGWQRGEAAMEALRQVPASAMLAARGMAP